MEIPISFHQRRRSQIANYLWPQRQSRFAEPINNFLQSFSAVSVICGRPINYSLKQALETQPCEICHAQRKKIFLYNGVKCCRPKPKLSISRNVQKLFEHLLNLAFAYRLNDHFSLIDRGFRQLSKHILGI